jgi:hypothetical protein
MIEVNFDVRRQQFWFYDDVGWCHTQWISPELRSVPPHTAYLPPSCSARGCLATINYVLNPGWSAAEEFVRTSTHGQTGGNQMAKKWEDFSIFKFSPPAGGVGLPWKGVLGEIHWKRGLSLPSCKTIVWFQELHFCAFPQKWQQINSPTGCIVETNLVGTNIFIVTLKPDISWQYS